MLEFKTPQIEDKAWVDQCFKHLKTMNCDYTFGRSGEIRVLLGSTVKMGTGTNVQKRLIAVHDLDIPWRLADL